MLHGKYWKILIFFKKVIQRNMNMLVVYSFSWTIKKEGCQKEDRKETALHAHNLIILYSYEL